MPPGPSRHRRPRTSRFRGLARRGPQGHSRASRPPHAGGADGLPEDGDVRRGARVPDEARAAVAVPPRLVHRPERAGAAHPGRRGFEGEALRPGRALQEPEARRPRPQLHPRRRGGRYGRDPDPPARHRAHEPARPPRRRHARGGRRLQRRRACAGLAVQPPEPEWSRGDGLSGERARPGPEPGLREGRCARDARPPRARGCVEAGPLRGRSRDGRRRLSGHAHGLVRERARHAGAPPELAEGRRPESSVRRPGGRLRHEQRVRRLPRPRRSDEGVRLVRVFSAIFHGLFPRPQRAVDPRRDARAEIVRRPRPIERRLSPGAPRSHGPRGERSSRRARESAVCRAHGAGGFARRRRRRGRSRATGRTSTFPRTRGRPPSRRSRGDPSSAGTARARRRSTFRASSTRERR